MSSNQYLVYTALVLGSIGAYGALNGTDGPDADSSLEALLSGEDVGSTDLAAILGSLSSRLSTLETSNSYEPRLTDTETQIDVNDGMITKLDTQVALNTGDISLNNTDLSEEIALNDSAISALDTALFTLESTVAGTVQVNVSDLQLAVGDLETYTGAKFLDGTIVIDGGKSLDARIKQIEDDRALEAITASTLSKNVGDNATAITTNFDSIDAIGDDILLVHAPEIKNNKDAVDSVTGNLQYIKDKFDRVVDETTGVDEMVCYNKLRVVGGAELALNNSYLRLGVSSDDAYMLYRSNTSPTGHNFGNYAARMRVFNSSSEGFVIENSDDEILFSVNGSDGFAEMQALDVADDVEIGGILYVGDTHITTERYEGISTTLANFGHKNYGGTANAALRQSDRGTTVLGGPTSVFVKIDDNEMIEVGADTVHIQKQLHIVQPDSNISDTHFNHNNEGSNWISCTQGGATYFRSYPNAPSVTIKEKEININGTDVLAKLNSLQSQIDNITTGNLDSRYVRIKDATDAHAEYIIEGHNDSWSKYLSYDGDNARWKNTTMRCRFRPNI